MTQVLYLTDRLRNGRPVMTEADYQQWVMNISTNSRGISAWTTCLLRSSRLSFG
jgi:hypothetical protein